MRVIEPDVRATREDSYVIGTNTHRRRCGTRPAQSIRMRPRLENLEDRTLLTVTITDVSVIEGNPGPTAITGRLDPGQETDSFRINGRGGQCFVFDAQSFSSTSGSWTLFGPANQTINGNFLGGDFTANLPYDGPYTLVLNGSLTSAPIDYTFRITVTSDPPIAPTGFGVVQAGMIATGQVQTFSYNAPAGLRIFYDSLDRDFDAIQVEFRDPDNNVVFGGPFTSASTDQGPFYLPRSGSYTLTVRGFDASSSGDYLFRLLNVAADATPLALNTTVTETLDPAFQTDAFRFTGSLGQRLYFDSLNTTFQNDTVRLVSPSGATVFGFGRTDFDTGPVTLTEAGTYELVVESIRSSPTRYSFRLLDPASQPLTLETDISGTLTPPVGADAYQFTGTAGQRLLFDSLAAGPAFSANWNLYGPNNQFINGTTLGFDFEATLPSDGVYTLVLPSSTTSGPVDYTVRVRTAMTTTTPLTLGETIRDTIAAPGAQEVYTFTGTPGQRLYFDALDSDPAFENLTVQLIAPSGAGVAGFFGDETADQGPLTLTEAGTYRLVLDGQGDATGDYGFRLIDVAAPPAQDVALDTIGTATLDPGLSAALFRFTGTAGQRLLFDSLAASSFAARWNLYGLNGQNLGGTALGFDFEATLPVDGPYTLVVSGTVASGPVASSFRIVMPTTTTTPLTLGDPVTAAIAAPGAQEVYTFTGTPGQRLYFDALDSDSAFENLTVQLIAPSGAGVAGFFGDETADQGPLTLTEAGTYRLVLDGQGDATGDYSFRLSDITAPPAVPLATPTQVTLDPGLQAQFFGIGGTAGQRFFFDGPTVSVPGSWRLAGPTGDLFHVGLGTDQEVVLPLDGAYTLILGGASGSGTISFVFRVDETTDSSVSPDGFHVPHSGTINAGDTATFTFTASAGTPVYFDSLNTDFIPLVAEITDPDGNLVFGLSVATDTGPFYLLRSGTYTVTVRGGFPSSTGDYNFRLLDLLDATPLTPGATISDSVPDFATDVFRFTGAAGQQLYFDGLATDFAFIIGRLVGPRGILTSLNPTGDTFAPRLPVDGTYYLILDGSQPGAADTRFRLLDVADQPSITLDPGTPTPISGTLDPNTSSHLVRFTGVGGQRLSFDSLSVSPSLAATWNLYGPDNLAINGTTLGFDFEATLPVDGPYTLVLSGLFASDPVTYSARVVVEQTTTTPLRLGDTVSGAIDQVGEQDVYTFTGTPGQRLYYDSLDRDFDAISATLTAPSGAAVFSFINSDSDFGPLTLTETGTYRLALIGSGSSTGDYSFRLLDVAAQPGPSLDPAVAAPISGTLDPGTGTDIVHFTGAAGQRLFFDSLSVSPSFAATWNLYGLNNQAINGATLGFDFEATLPVDGEYVLVLNGSSTTGLISYSARVVVSQTATAALTLGHTITDTIAQVGEQDVYTFTGTVGQRISYDALDRDFDAISAQLFAPSGASVFFIDSDSDSGPFTLTEAGTYRLLIDGSGTTTGDYAFRLLDTAQPVILLNATAADFTVSLSEPSASPVTVVYQTTDGTATAGSDYVAIPPTILTFAPGETTRTITVQLVRDTAPEADETFFVTLSGATGATIADSQGAGTILNDDGPAIFIDNVTQVERDSGTTAFVFTVTLSVPSSVPVSVNTFTTDGSATTTSDYTVIPTTTLTFAPGQTTRTITVVVNADTTPEFNEAFFVNLVSSVNGVILDNQGTGTILNDDTAVFIDNTSVFEDSSGTTNARFTVSLSQASALPVSVHYGTADGTATAPSDYTAGPDTVLTFAPGETVKTITVAVHGDTVAEDHETFFVNLSDPTNATLVDPQGVGTILNDDTSIVIDDVVQAEGDAGATALTFTVSLTAASTLTVTVDFRTAGGTATSGVDFVSIPTTTLTFAPGEISKRVTVLVTGDAVAEDHESFVVNLANATNAVIADPQGAGTILNDDALISINNATVFEGDSVPTDVVFTVSLTFPVAQTVTVHYSTADGSATAPSDYTAVPDSVLTFAPGETTWMITVAVTGDAVAEDHESFVVNLFDAANGLIVDNQGAGSILNDDTAVVIDDLMQVEGDGGTSNLIFTVSLSHASAVPVTVHYGTADGTAAAGNDYVALPDATLTFAPGQTSQLVSVTVDGDTTPEPHETFFVNLSNASGATIADPQGQGTILNTDAEIRITDASVTEGHGGSTNAVFTVGIRLPVVQTVTVQLATADGTTVAGSDYTALPATTLIFAPGQTSTTVTVAVLGDTRDETDETFVVNLSGATGATIADGQARGTIVDDDAGGIIQFSPATYGAAENGRTATITVTRTGGSASGVTVAFATSDGTATAGADYAASSGTLTFGADETSKSFTIAILDDRLVEGDETVSLALSAPGGGASLGSPSAATLAITDFEEGRLRFSAAAYSAAEDGGTATITVTRTDGSDGTVTVQFATSDGTATAGADYSAGAGTLSFGPGVTAQTFTVPILDDTRSEGDETVHLALVVPTGGASLGTPSTAVLTIVDDDAAVLQITAFTVQRGSIGRSFVRYASLTFNQGAGLSELIASVNDADPHNDRIRLIGLGLDGTSHTPVSLTARLGAIDRVIEADFGANGITGHPSTTAGDGYYEFQLDLDGDGSFEPGSTRRFSRLLGDVNGNHRVTGADVNLIVSALGTSGVNLNADVNGDGVVNLIDCWLALRAYGRRLADCLSLDG